MPPKAKKDVLKPSSHNLHWFQGNKNQGPVEDESGIPKNEVSFKFTFQVKQNEVENIMVMFEWIKSSDLSAREKFDTDLIESWDQVNPEGFIISFLNDNNLDPMTLAYEIDLPSLRVEDNFVKNICSNKFYIHFVSTEDQCVKDSIHLHYSPLLTAKGEPKVKTF